MSIKNEKILVDEVTQIIKRACYSGVMDERDDTVIFLDLDRLKERIEYVRECYLENSLHTVAIKSNPILKYLKECINNGAGLEAASIGEVRLALVAGISPKKIVFDSPVKTRDDLYMCLENGIHINIDNFQELKIIEELNPVFSESTIGIRVNPQIGVGKIKALSTAGHYSKFGIPIKYEKENIKEAFKRNSWLCCLHIHCGSVGLEPHQLTLGIQTIYSLAKEINDYLEKNDCTNRVTTIDFGGGFAPNFMVNGEHFTLKHYVDMLKIDCPGLLENFKIITEYGRFYSLPIGFIASKVEYVKKQPDKNTALINAGADLLLRECYMPNDIHHDYSFLNSKFEKKQLDHTDQANRWNIAGPLCFEGDIPGRDLIAPELEPGDFVIIHDSGGNSINMWSRYCSRLAPKVIGVKRDSMKVLKEKETYEDLIRFWGGSNF